MFEASADVARASNRVSPPPMNPSAQPILTAPDRARPPVCGSPASPPRRLIHALGLGLFLGLLLWAEPGTTAHAQPEAPSRGMVASVHSLATAAGVAALRQGGNAVDAAVAVALTLGVVDPANSGIGGGCFFLIRRANGEIIAIDGRETAPGAATRDLFVRDGKADPELSQTGALASGVPGELAACAYAVEHFGRKSLRDLILPAADLAEYGFAVAPAFTNRVNSVAEALARFPATRAIFFARDGHPFKTGDWLRQLDLAATYRHIAAEGPDWFYRGPFAHSTETWMKANGGLLQTNDFQEYQVRLRAPISSSYRGFQLVSFPPPSSGGVHVLQVLNLLEHFDLKSFDEATRLHVIAEAMKLAFADRAYWLGDPDFVPVPRGLVGKPYARELAARIDPNHTTPVAGHGSPPDWQHDTFGKHTTHFSVADAEGNWVACTATINTTFGSKVVIPGTGVLLNNQIDDFSLQPGVPNAFKLIGGEANAVGARKRPLSSMSPTLVLKDGRPVIALGAAGGPTIISQVILELVAMLDLGLTPAEALAQPRIHQQWSPDELLVEKSLPAPLQRALAERGHHLRQSPAIGTSQIVARSPDGQGFLGAADPRAGGTAAGW